MRLTLSSITLSLGLLAGFASTAYAEQVGSFDISQKSQIEGVVHNYLVKNPEVIAEAVKNLQQKQYEEMRKKTLAVAMKNTDKLFNDANDPVVGNPNASVAVVEFFDYQCPHCVDMSAVFPGLVKANKDVKVIYKDFPIRGPVSMLAAKAALAANKQNKYVEMHDALMSAAQSLNAEKIDTLAKNVGLDFDKFTKDMNSKEVDNMIKATYKLAGDLQLVGTPAIFVAKAKSPTSVEFVPGQIDQAGLQALVEKVKK